MTNSGIRAAKAANAPRRGLSRVEAAIYVGISSTKFDEMVSDGRMPGPKRIDARKVWDIRALDLAFDGLPEDKPNSWASHDLAAAPNFAGNSLQSTKSRRGGTMIPMPDDPATQKIIDDLVQRGLTRRYAPGAWQAEVRGRPMGIREREALGAYYAARTEAPREIKGAGLATTQRLEARGYIAAAEARDDRAPLYHITPEGEAAWSALPLER